MACVIKGSHSVSCTPLVYPLTEWTILPFAFPAEAGTHLPTPEGWKAELTLGGWLVTYWNRCPAPGIEPDTVTHLSTNPVRRRLTSLIKANVVTTTPDHQPLSKQKTYNDSMKLLLGGNDIRAFNWYRIRNWSSFVDPGGMEGWVGLRTLCQVVCGCQTLQLPSNAGSKWHFLTVHLTVTVCYHPGPVTEDISICS